MTEDTIGRGDFAAENNNEANSIRGTFVVNDEDGPFVHPGASSSDPVLSVDATTIRVQGKEWQLSSGTVTLAPNTGSHPRADLVIARRGTTPNDPGRYDVLTGDPIDDAAWQTLTHDDPNDPHTPVIDGQTGDPLYPPDQIPEIQPPDATGLRSEAVVLAMCYAPPGMGDSTDIADAYVTDFSAEGVSFADVLRSGDAIKEVEAATAPLDVDIAGTAANAKALNGLSGAARTGGTFSIGVGPATLKGNSDIEQKFLVLKDASQSIELWGFGVHSTDENQYNKLLANFGNMDTYGSLIDRTTHGVTSDTYDGPLNGGPRAVLDGPRLVGFELFNGTGSTLTAQAYFNVRIVGR